MNTIIAYFNKPLLKYPIIFGLITGLLGFAYFLALHLMGIHPLSNTRVPEYGLYVIMMCFGCWYYRKKIGFGFLHLWEALTICYVINMVGAFIAGWFIYLFVTFVDPSIFEQLRTDNLQLLLDKKDELLKTIGEVDYLNLVAEIKANEPSILISDELSKKFLMGILPIIIISLLFRKQPPALIDERRK